MGNEQTQSNSALSGALSGRRKQSPRGFLRSRRVFAASQGLTGSGWYLPEAREEQVQRIHKLYTPEQSSGHCPCQGRLAEGNSAGSFVVLYSSSLTNPMLNKMSFQISTTTAINLQIKPEWSSPKSRAVKSLSFCTDKRAL